MGNFNDVQLLAAMQFDGVTNSLDAPDSISHGGGVAGGDLTGFPTGPTAVAIEELTFVAADLTFTDPNADHYIGYTIDYTIDGGANYVSALAVTANADLPQIWDDTAGDTADFSLDTPLNAFGFIGGADASSSKALGGNRAPVVIPANAFCRLRVGTYVDGALVATTGLDNLEAYIWGKRI